MSLTREMDPDDVTVHDVIGRLPGAGEVFRSFGIDTCCGGDLPVAVAADHHGVELETLLAALDRAGAET